MKSQQSKRKRRTPGSLDLEGKVLEAGGASFGLEIDQTTQDSGIAVDSNSVYQADGLYGNDHRSLASRGTYRSSRRFHSRSSHGKPRSQHSVSASPIENHQSTAARSSYSASSGRLRRAAGGSSRSGRSGQSRHWRMAKSTRTVHIVCAIGENLARETCVSSLDAGSPISLQVTKQANGQTYAQTLAYLDMLQPHEVLLNEGRKNSPLARKVLAWYESRGFTSFDTAILGEKSDNISDHGPTRSTIVKFISRAYFDQTKGAELLAKVARPDTYDPTLLDEYILLSSTYALLHYTQQTLGTHFSRKCLDINVNSGGKNRMSIDRSTLLQLELLSNARTGKTKNSLISAIDCTKTTVGSRLLRSCLMAPPNRPDTINSRLDLVDTFLESEDFFYSVLDHLQSLPPVDKMLTNIAVVPRPQHQRKNAEETPVITARLASRGISALVCVKSTLTALPSLADVLREHLAEAEVEAPAQGEHHADEVTAATGRSSLLIGLGSGPPSTGHLDRNHLLRAIYQTLSQPQLSEILESISNIFTDSTTYSRNANAMRHQECFALKSNENGMMDVIRKAFLANVDDIYKKADEYAEVHGTRVTVRYSTTRGYYLSVPEENASSLPEVFIQPTRCGRSISCTTEEVHSLNIRAQDNVQDLLLMTYERIQEVLGDARAKYDSLASVSDAIALLDLCHSFADKVTLSKFPWCRPSLLETHSIGRNERYGMLIQEGRYGIDATSSCLGGGDGPGEIIPNDTYVPADKVFTVLSGINGSGKSTYLKQIAIIVLLAHCGSYVPAQEATIPLRSRLFARMGTSDDQENNISSFMLEMKETAFICSNASEKSLILLDELGRATSNEDGVAIAWAVSEFLLSSGAMTFFVTHYPQLCRLSDVYPRVQNQHLKASISSDAGEDIQYTHKLKPGPCVVTPDYGIGMASSCGWPSDILVEARRIESNVQETMGKGSDTAHPVKPDATMMSTYLEDLSANLLQTVQKSESLETSRSKLQNLKHQDSHNGLRVDHVLEHLIQVGTAQADHFANRLHDGTTNESNDNWRSIDSIPATALDENQMVLEELPDACSNGSSITSDGDSNMLA